MFETVARYWEAAGRCGAPRNVAQVNVALGPTAAAARASIRAYYGFTGDTDRMVAGLVTEPAALRATVRAFADRGVDEVVCYHWPGNPIRWSGSRTWGSPDRHCRCAPLTSCA
ncbi:hypothetical protein [Pseudonocardia sp. N23]|uniref:hypothetical protein n=1 Tax=Pseudonocardia sp. N23 TaxID=1987376 RepID=UPI000BFB1DEF|nr:hypothetical protein [Pseudonocardia sp. N23]GAY12301.1 conserved hypothetical protein [Pseudonocardia sp. N23]